MFYGCISFAGLAVLFSIDWRGVFYLVSKLDPKGGSLLGNKRCLPVSLDDVR